MKITWNENGWTTIQEADAEKHILEVCCLAEDGIVKEVRRRHNDGEEEKLTKALSGEYELPMPLDEFKKLYTKKKIVLK